MKRRNPTKIGSKVEALLAATLAVLSVSGMAAAAKKKKPTAATAVVAGTVFREPGFALPGAEITLAPEKAPAKAKLVKAVSDARGEFAFHVPAEEARYTVSVKAKGFESQEKSAAISGEVRADVFFQLKPVAK
jgi:hypothetical protein